jgi:hypothetical protein
VLLLLRVLPPQQAQLRVLQQQPQQGLPRHLLLLVPTRWLRWLLLVVLLLLLVLLHWLQARRLCCCCWLLLPLLQLPSWHPT